MLRLPDDASRVVVGPVAQGRRRVEDAAVAEEGVGESEWLLRGNSKIKGSKQ